MVNRAIRNFEIKELIATGGMAAIYKAVQVSLDRTVAIKILHGHLAQDKDFITRFEREAKAAANLKHENIVNVIDFGKTEDVYFIAMEYVEGRSLKDLINSVAFMPYDIALMIALDISRGLYHAHQKGVVHRDIKPANILIGLDGAVKIADFGLAQAQDLISVTVTGSIVGTPAYMSPEQAGGKKIDHRSDLFSLGVVMYEMITGGKPFKGQNYSSIIHEILTVAPPKPFEANPLIPREISAIIEKMLNKDPEQRYQNADEVSGEITAYFRKTKNEISRAKITQFVNAPEKYLQGLRQERKEKHLERGLYFLGLGSEKIDEAISEFNQILQLDPNDARAAKYLTELKTKKVKKAERSEVRKQQKEAIVKKRPRPIAVILIPVFILAALIVTLVGLKSKKTPPLKPPKNYGITVIGSHPEGAAIYLDSVDLGLLTPATQDSVLPGPHAVELRKTGYQPYKQTFDLKGGDTVTLNPVLIKVAAAAAYGRINIRSVPPGASVLLDNADAGFKTPCVLESVAAGSHTLKFIKTGFESMETSCPLQSGQLRQVTITLKPVTAPPVPGTSYLKIAVNPWAKIYIDGLYSETTPVAKSIAVTSGSHLIRLENPNFKIWQKKVQFDPSQTVTLDVNLEYKEGFLRITVKPWADVYIDGKFIETTPIAGSLRLTAGKHALKLINPTFQTYDGSIAIPADDTLRKHVDLVAK